MLNKLTTALRQAARDAAARAATQPAQGTVVDVGPAGSLTLAHQGVTTCSLPPMTTTFVVEDEALLERLKRGDPIRFRAIDDGARYVVTHLEVAPAPKSSTKSTL